MSGIARDTHDAGSMYENKVSKSSIQKVSTTGIDNKCVGKGRV